jgi:hypothetical protein
MVVLGWVVCWINLHNASLKLNHLVQYNLLSSSLVFLFPGLKLILFLILLTLCHSHGFMMLKDAGLLDHLSTATAIHASCSCVKW